MTMTTNHTTTTERPRRTTRRLVLALATVVALAASLFGAGATAPAGAASRQNLTLTISPYLPGIHCFDVQGLVPMGAYEAHGYTNNGAFALLTMSGDDPGLTDDLLVGPLTATKDTYDPRIFASEQGIHIWWWGCVSSDVLDEDWGGDEVYVDGVLFHGGGGVLGDLMSNQIHRSF
jgi:hypothetical protein